MLERALVQLEPGSASAAPLMALLVDVHLATGDPERAAAAAQQLDACAARHPGPYLAAAAALAMGQVRLATGDGEGARTCLRAALAGFAGADLPMELACARLELANAAITERPEVAMAEARAAFGGSSGCGRLATPTRPRRCCGRSASAHHLGRAAAC